jgi:hypothetical protein
MYVNRNTNHTYSVDLNVAEYRVLKKVFDRLLFNPEGVSNQFKLPTEEVEIVRKMNGTLYGIRY